MVGFNPSPVVECYRCKAQRAFKPAPTTEIMNALYDMKWRTWPSDQGIVWVCPVCYKALLKEGREKQIE